MLPFSSYIIVNKKIIPFSTNRQHSTLNSLVC